MVLVGLTAVLPGTSSIDIDNVAAGTTLVEHLIEKGHRRIAYLSCCFRQGSTIERTGGFMQALRNHEIDQKNCPALTTEFDSLDAARRAKKSANEEGEGIWGALLADEILNMPAETCPTALFCWSADITVDVIKRLNEKGFSVPKDFSVCAVDDSPLAQRANLIVVRQPLSQIGRRAAQVLIDKLRNRQYADEQVRFLGELIIRTSTRQILSSAGAGGGEISKEGKK